MENTGVLLTLHDNAAVVYLIPHTKINPREMSIAYKY